MSDAANTRWKVFGVERAHSAEDAGCEEPERKTEHQHRIVSERETGVTDDDNARAKREDKERQPPADTIRKETAT